MTDTNADDDIASEWQKNLEAEKAADDAALAKQRGGPGAKGDGPVEEDLFRFDPGQHDSVGNCAISSQRDS